MNVFHDRRPTLQNITKRAKSYGAVRCNFGPFPKIPGANSSAVVRDINSLVPKGAVGMICLKNLSHAGALYSEIPCLLREGVVRRNCRKKHGARCRPDLR